jgi:hypothetical protein
MADPVVASKMPAQMMDVAGEYIIVPFTVDWIASSPCSSQ